MKAIKCCGDCGYYNWKKHNCEMGASEKGEAQDKFYIDCPLDDVTDLIKKAEKYRWHDLRKNPEDLPENDGWYIVCKGRYYSIVTTCGYNDRTKSFDCGNLWVVKAWREIEPFEEETE